MIFQAGRERERVNDVVFHMCGKTGHPILDATPTPLSETDFEQGYKSQLWPLILSDKERAKAAERLLCRISKTCARDVQGQEEDIHNYNLLSF